MHTWIRVTGLSFTLGLGMVGAANGIAGCSSSPDVAAVDGDSGPPDDVNVPGDTGTGAVDTGAPHNRDGGEDASDAAASGKDGGEDASHAADSGKDGGSGSDGEAAMDGQTTESDSGVDGSTFTLPDSGPGILEDGGSAQPPSSGGGATAVTAVHNFAIHHLYLGDGETPEGAPGWVQLGYDVDHLTTTASSTNVCTQAAGANLSSQQDGVNGIDNSFGENIVPMLAAIVPSPSATCDTSIAAGSPTLTFDVTGLDEASATQTATGLAAQAFPTVLFGGVPTFTTADNWPVDQTYVASAIGDGGVLGTPVGSKILFASPYVAGGTFVGRASTLSVTLDLTGAPLVLTIQNPVVTFASQGTHAANGVISGVILAQDLVNAMHVFGATLSTSLCSGATWASVENTILKAQDIMADGTNAAGAPCDAISIGLGFDADEIGQPETSAPPPKPVDPCGPVDASGE